MSRKLTVLTLGASLFAALAAPAHAADVSLLRLDCGTPQPPTPVNQRFSDTYAFGDQIGRASCRERVCLAV